MFSLSSMSSTTAVLSTYTTFAASAVLVRTVINEVQNMTNQIIPKTTQERIMSRLGILIGNLSSTMSIIINENNGLSNNEVFKAAELYLRTRISPHVNQLKVSRGPREKHLAITINKGEEVIDTFDGLVLKWKFICTFVLERSNAIEEERKDVKLYAGCYPGGDYEGPWGSVNLDHPSTFDTLAMDPPGTGKSSLIAAMANFLKFDIFDLELASLQSNSELRRLLVSTKDRSIVVIEDIDCSIDLENREDEGFEQNTKAKQNHLTLSGLLNFIDGLWSSCGDERIIVFTTNHKDKLDPALIRPGRMDMHIHMSYCTFSGFRILASNYQGIKSHSKFDEIEKLIGGVEITPAEIAEELIKSEEGDIAMENVVNLLCKKRGIIVEKDIGTDKKDKAVTEETNRAEEESKKGKNEELKCFFQRMKYICEKQPKEKQVM